VRFFTLVDLAVGAIAVFAPDEVRCAHALGMASAEPVARSPTAFSAIGAVRVPAAETKSVAPCEVRAHTSGIHQIQQGFMGTIRLRNPDKCVGCHISPT
jgi:hypothetical protein